MYQPNISIALMWPRLRKFSTVDLLLMYISLCSCQLQLAMGLCRPSLLCMLSGTIRLPVKGGAKHPTTEENDESDRNQNCFYSADTLSLWTNKEMQAWLMLILSLPLFSSSLLIRYCINQRNIAL